MSSHQATVTSGETKPWTAAYLQVWRTGEQLTGEQLTGGQVTTSRKTTFRRKVIKYWTYPIDHEEKDAIVCDCSHRDIKSGDDAELPSSLKVIDECVSRSIKQVACDATLRERQLIPEERSSVKGFRQYPNSWVVGVVRCLLRRAAGRLQGGSSIKPRKQVPRTRWRLNYIHPVSLLEIVQTDHVVVQRSQLDAAHERSETQRRWQLVWKEGKESLKEGEPDEDVNDGTFSVGLGIVLTS